jgi:hypothetical protein
MAMTVQTNDKQLRRLEAIAKSIGSNLKKELAVAINKTAKKCESSIAKKVSKEIVVSQKVIKSQLQVQKAKAGGEQRATVTLKVSTRIPLRDFGARQTKAGVSYKISRTSGRGFVQGAFQGPKPGVMKASWRGNVFKRTTKSRLPIVKLMGPSVWGAFVINDHVSMTAEETQAELQKQVEERIRFLTLKKTGAI